MRKIVGIEHYEERLLYLTLYLGDPGLRIVYPTSVPLEPAVVDYYLGFLDDPADARRRLHLVPLGDPEPIALSAKLVRHPDALREIATWADDAEHAHMLPFMVTSFERQVADTLDLPLFGPHPDLAALGSKSGSRQVAARAGVEILEGVEDLWSLEAVESAVAGLQRRPGGVDAVVVKLNHGFSGQGNAIVSLDGAHTPLEAARTTFCALEESWPSFSGKVAAEGAIVEELLRHPRLASPSVQLRVEATGEVEVVSTHDQVLARPDDQVYLGCRFPADARYRAAIVEAGRRVAEVLASDGVIGHFGIDFLVTLDDSGPRVYLSEINLRMGGTTHPFGMARMVTGGTYDPDSDQLLCEDGPRCYVATDNLKSENLMGRSPTWAIETLDKAGLAYNPSSRTGATLHLLGALSKYGKGGVTCIGRSAEEAGDLYQQVLTVLEA